MLWNRFEQDMAMVSDTVFEKVTGAVSSRRANKESHLLGFNLFRWTTDFFPME